MKVFIVFTALVLVFAAAFVYVSDMNSYVQLQRHMKALAEECSAGGALLFTEEAYSDGEIIISQPDAQRFAEQIIQTSKISSTPLSFGNLSVSAELVSPDAIKATVFYTADPGRDIFRLPFLSVTTVSRSALYAWE